MPLLKNLITGIRALFQKEQRSRDMDEELLAFQQASAEEKIRSGLSPQEAQRAARVEMGSIETVKQKVRSATWESTAESIAHDIRYGVRQLLRSPGFTIVAVLTSGPRHRSQHRHLHPRPCGSAPIVTRRQPPAALPHWRRRQLLLWKRTQNTWNYFSYALYQHLVESTPQFEQIAAFSTFAFPVSIRQAASAAPARQPKENSSPATTSRPSECNQPPADSSVLPTTRLSRPP